MTPPPKIDLLQNPPRWYPRQPVQLWFKAFEPWLKPVDRDEIPACCAAMRRRTI